MRIVANFWRFWQLHPPHLLWLFIIFSKLESIIPIKPKVQIKALFPYSCLLQHVLLGKTNFEYILAIFKFLSSFNFKTW